ncbi:acyl-CoA/acyl-ACP dehydrogenase [Aldersonia sp. NBC_00410]|uniref:acyl-CoA dehydrogenase family protein n=1 Tax=Aldersonia sp. NBC_00410 TaxID=2975954 RepID=UPI00225A976B|nr:acyl-CoA dehydrogenase family protein [Aldersonia sp. NBC_00410]MCX5043502.1 acyl-CoA/acyl-ACP dehydrogenase [Aldersonia sp. NBC_00410]
MTTTSLPAPETQFALDEELLARIADRADRYDQAGEFFIDDFTELRDAGYYRAPVPAEFGGAGLSLAELARWHRRVAYRSSSTALASGMHLFWVGAAADLHRAGDHSADWLLEAVADGAIIAAGHSESGNDLGLGGSTTKAEPQPDGGYRFTGHKHFTSLSPVWTHLGVHGRDTSDPAVIVHAFLDRADPGARTVENWNTFALRATRSDDTALDGAYSPADRVIARTGPDLPESAYLASVAAWALTLTSNVYLGIGQRAFDTAVAATARPSAKLGGAARATDPLVQAALADAVVELDSIEAHLDTAAREWTQHPHGSIAWGRRLQSAKQHATIGAKRVVDASLQLVGGRALHHGSTIERLYRDVAAGVLHNPTPDTIRATLGSPNFVALETFDR